MIEVGGSDGVLEHSLEGEEGRGNVWGNASVGQNVKRGAEGNVGSSAGGNIGEGAEGSVGEGMERIVDCIGEGVEEGACVAETSGRQQLAHSAATLRDTRTGVVRRCLSKLRQLQQRLRGTEGKLQRSDANTSTPAAAAAAASVVVHDRGALGVKEGSSSSSSSSSGSGSSGGGASLRTPCAACTAGPSTARAACTAGPSTARTAGTGLMTHVAPSTTETLGMSGGKWCVCV